MNLILLSDVFVLNEVKAHVERPVGFVKAIEAEGDNLVPVELEFEGDVLSSWLALGRAPEVVSAGGLFGAEVTVDEGKVVLIQILPAEIVIQLEVEANTQEQVNV